MIFSEVDVGFRHPYFNIETALASLVPHEDGRPKATRFISCYRVLEHTDYDALMDLYLTNPDGTCMRLEEAAYD